MPIHNVPQSVDIFQQTDTLPFADLHFWHDPEVQLRAIIAIHDTTMGPALGGCRMVPYDSTNAAIFDALNLARGMTYKSAINELPYGGGKSVIIHPGVIKDRHQLMQSFGHFVESLGGRYITAVDSGTGTQDMDDINQSTAHVFCTSQRQHGTGDPSPFTAKGVFHCIQATAQFINQHHDLTNLHIVVQGAGHVGYQLIKLLTEAGAFVTVCDNNPAAVEKCVQDFAVRSVTPDQVYDVVCDIFSPCALGQVINPDTLKRLKTKAIAGAANNQLLNDTFGEQLRQAGILYAPDFLINSGGMLQITFSDLALLNQKLEALYDILLTIYEAAQQQQKATNTIAIDMAKAILETHRMTAT